METKQYLIDFYNTYDEDSRLALKHGMVEFLTTMHYINKYIKSGDCVLEIGAATGRYSHTLARQGYDVDAVELVEQYMREAVDSMDDDAFVLYLKYHLATCEREDLVGVTSHAIDIFRK